jgi:signal transduction histidine kinase
VTRQARVIARVMTVTAGIVAVLVVLGLPAVYFGISHQYMLGALDTQAEVTAAAAGRLVVANPKMWIYEEIRLEELLSRRDVAREAEVRRILDLQGRVVAHSSEELDWPVVARAKEISDAGITVARVEVVRSLRPLAVQTALVGLLSVLFAGVVFAALRLIPLRAIRQAYLSLEESERRYRSLYASMREGIALHRLVVDPVRGPIDFTVVDLNPSCASLLGAEPGRLVGQDAASFLGGALQPHLPQLAQAVERAEALTFEVALTGPPRVLHVSVFSPQDGHFATLLDDVTQRRQAEALQLQLQDRLAQSQRLESIGRLAGGVAHDLNNRLAPVLAYSGLLLEDEPPGSERAADLAEIKRSAERARDLVRQLLAFGRKQVLDLRTVDLRETLGHMEKLLRRTLREDVELQLKVPATLGLVKADAGQMEQVVLNLVVNAQQALTQAGRIEVELADLDVPGPGGPPNLPLGHWTMLAVSDTGRGMDEAVLARAFEPFFTTKVAGEGTGLGLAIVHGIVTQHGGQVVASSTPGRGSTFSVFLPRLDREALAPEPPEPPEAPATATWLRGRTILVAEDDDVVRGVAVRVLERLGYRVLAARDGGSCLGLASDPATAIDLLLSDVVMPDMNGRQLHQRLTETRPGLRVLFMSGYAGNVIDQHGVLAEGAGFIQKPFTAPDLARAIQGLLRAG